MPTYDFHCSACDSRLSLRRTFADCSTPEPCSCGGEAKRVFSARFQLITDRYVDQPENKYALGFDEGTRRETMKADDAAYERQWEGKTVSKPTPPKDLLTTYKEMWSNPSLSTLPHATL